MAIDQRSIRYKIVFGLVLAISAVLVFILIKLQLMDPYYSDKAKSITLNQNIIQPSRGLFYDRNGKLLVINYPAYDIYVNYNKISKDLDTNNLCFLLNIPKHKFSEFKKIILDFQDLVDLFVPYGSIQLHMVLIF